MNLSISGPKVFYDVGMDIDMTDFIDIENYEILKSEELSMVHAKRVDTYLQSSKYYGKVGVFEGAGYAPQGLYRPMIDCIMFTKGEKPFCKVCENAIIQVIKHYSE